MITWPEAFPEEAEQLRVLVTAWRDAREAIFAKPLDNREGWVALGEAENNLMKFAREHL